ncbi:MAG: hypothetical protein US50_C0004G0042 [Candidatus Nomurabacteria bacterium GW2011_GWB1_37_5]|uniref:Uncharacterized protein n=1 Tax=Candidatus Nomurabacteria bacterium GW2011_GWB1_37_5 TaxID=1618742 RepID=A0A0G0GXZ1_9BACT|nr:MAG: hypothetical protein US50_C0004G0042 [Candidatus Nomurabacteria bacterium GW2011_GWB1_37_5]
MQKYCKICGTLIAISLIMAHFSEDFCFSCEKEKAPHILEFMPTVSVFNLSVNSISSTISAQSDSDTYFLNQNNK